MEQEDRKIHLRLPRWAAWAIAVGFALILIVCWVMSLALWGGFRYELGRTDEYLKNPARIYIEDGTPFVWYNGSYFKVQYVGKKTFRAVP